jgi:hypothetical protein
MEATATTPSVSVYVLMVSVAHIVRILIVRLAAETEFVTQLSVNANVAMDLLNWEFTRPVIAQPVNVHQIIKTIVLVTEAALVLLANVTMDGQALIAVVPWPLVLATVTETVFVCVELVSAMQTLLELTAAYLHVLPMRWVRSAMEKEPVMFLPETVLARKTGEERIVMIFA